MARRPKLTDAERERRRAADRERLKQAAEQLLTSDGWQRWVRLRSRAGLARLSLSNQLLVALARPDASFVAGFKAWLDLGYCVRKGEKAIRILAPVAVKEHDEHGEENGEKRIFFRTVPVFDVHMTERLPGREPVPLTPPAQPIEGDSHAHLIAALIDLGRELGYTIEIRELPADGLGGWCDAERHEIVVATGAANRQVRTLVPWRKGRIPTFGMLSRDRCRVVVRAGRSEARNSTGLARKVAQPWCGYARSSRGKQARGRWQRGRPRVVRRRSEARASECYCFAGRAPRRRPVWR